jgi:hypothetical protein
MSITPGRPTSQVPKLHPLQYGAKLWEQSDLLLLSNGNGRLSLGFCVRQSNRKVLFLPIPEVENFSETYTLDVGTTAAGCDATATLEP